MLFSLTIVLVILCLLILAFAAVVVYARWNYGILEKTGVPLIQPTFCFGSIPDLHLKVQTDEDIKRFKNFGPIWGLYEGRTPIIYICDPELIREIFVMDVNYFYDRRVGHFGDERIDEILDYLPGEKWKKMRKFQTILFSSGKIRQYSKKLGDAAHDFVDFLIQKCDENGRVKVDARKFMDIVSLDGIARVSFGVKLENVEDPENLFYRGLKKLLGEGLEYDWLYSLSMVFPILHKIAPSFCIEPVLFETFQEIVNTRQKERKINCQQNAPNDLADLLVEGFEKLSTPEYKRLGITSNTLLAQALNVSALDMISASMSMLCHYLCKNPNIQDKLHQELDSLEGEIDHENINQLKYLGACINETLRLAPPLIRPERVCTRDWESSSNESLKIKKGTVVMVPLWAAHRNPVYFKDPEAFIPERFVKGSEQYEQDTWHPCAFSPFGLGLRSCIGMRLAMETLKMNVACIFKRFKVLERSDTKLEFKPGMLFLLQFKELYFDFVQRH